MSLSGNMFLSEMIERKLKWKTQQGEERETSHLTNLKSLTFKPLQIRTFEINLAIK